MRHALRGLDYPVRVGTSLEIPVMDLMFRGAQRGDEEKLTRFNEEACGAHVPPEFWRWKYFDNPAGPPSLAVALDGDRIVGRTAMYAIRMRVGNVCMIARQESDVDVLREYRRGGTFRRLEKTAMSTPPGFGYPFTFGMANETARKVGTTAYGYRLVASVRKMVKVLDPTPFVAGRIHVRLPRFVGGLIRRGVARGSSRGRSDAGCRAVERFDERFDSLWERAPKLPIMVVKDAEYLNWRYLRCPHLRYHAYGIELGGRLVGLFVFHVVEKDGVKYGILDDMLCQSSDSDEELTLAGLAVRQIAGHAVHAIVCWLPEHHPLNTALLRRGFMARPTPNYLIVRRESEGIPEGFLEEERNWCYMIGDSDYWLFPREH
jgi:hypothetical protein